MNKAILALTLALLLVFAACGGGGSKDDPGAVLIGTWSVHHAFPGSDGYTFSMTINADGTYDADGSPGTWSSSEDGRVSMRDEYLVFGTSYRFEVSDNGNTIVITATVGNWEVSTLTRTE